MLDLVCYCDLDRDPMTFIYEHTNLTRITLKAFESYRLTDRHTDTTEIIYHAGGHHDATQARAYTICSVHHFLI